MHDGVGLVYDNSALSSLTQHPPTCSTHLHPLSPQHDVDKVRCALCDLDAIVRAGGRVRVYLIHHHRASHIQPLEGVYGMVWYGLVWYGIVWYGMVWYGMVRIDQAG